MFESYTKGRYLAETTCGMGVELIDENKIPPSPLARWDLCIGGSALTPRQAATVITGAPLAAAGGAIVTVASLAAFSKASAAVGATGIGVLAGTSTVLNDVLTEVSNNLLVV